MLRGIQVVHTRHIPIKDLRLEIYFNWKRDGAHEPQTYICFTPNKSEKWAAKTIPTCKTWNKQVVSGTSIPRTKNWCPFKTRPTHLPPHAENYTKTPVRHLCVWLHIFVMPSWQVTSFMTIGLHKSLKGCPPGPGNWENQLSPVPIPQTGFFLPLVQ